MVPPYHESSNTASNSKVFRQFPDMRSGPYIGFAHLASESLDAYVRMHWPLPRWGYCRKTAGKLSENPCYDAIVYTFKTRLTSWTRMCRREGERKGNRMKNRHHRIFVVRALTCVNSFWKQRWFGLRLHNYYSWAAQWVLLLEFIDMSIPGRKHRIEHMAFYLFKFRILFREATVVYVGRWSIDQISRRTKYLPFIPT